MILYDYRCEVCHHSFDKLAKMNDYVVECPNCGASANRTVSAPLTIKLTGIGNYKNGTFGRK